MIGVVVVRNGQLNLGATEVAAVVTETWLIGEQLAVVTNAPSNVSRCLEVGPFDPVAYASMLASRVGDESVVLSAEPDGRDLAGQLAERLDRDVLAGCLSIGAGVFVTPVFGAQTTIDHRPSSAVVATVQPLGTTAGAAHSLPTSESASSTESVAQPIGRVIAPDPATADLADADRIVAGGAGLADEQSFARLGTLAPSLGAAMGATRVIADRGWVPFARQIGTTGTVVHPQLYVAFGVSGAVQHTAGLGAPEHIISINTDPACPMSQMADLALVADATLTLDALAQLLSESS